MKKDFYEVLGVSKNATKNEIKSAYRKSALKYHPDRNKAPDAEDRFKEINEAYEVLSNDQKKSAYDQFGHAAFDPNAGPFGGRTYTQQSGPFNFTYSQSGGNVGGADFDFGGFSNPFDIFEQFFGAGFASQQSRGRRLETYKISLSFLEAANGVEKEFSIDGKRRKIKIPAGVDDGQRIRFKDFILYIDVLPDKIFKREGNDIFVTVNLTFSQAVLGTEIKVPTLTEPVKVRVKSGTQPNTLIRLRGRGIKQVTGFGIGDLYIRLMVEIPTKLTSRQKDLVRELGL
ncbi:MAG TPA: DnaJ C-terminal domain-containing protein [Candidatus Woesebacteria bacterium]|nr:DnaJ C-terminal domain-containing protein [Candidatus Woesebacteria bacterium]HOG37620.1 DnaJ C-terminal domain-containing protein [Candidatus Woesebacteria bacterium]